MGSPGLFPTFPKSGKGGIFVCMGLDCMGKKETRGFAHRTKVCRPILLPMQIH